MRLIKTKICVVCKRLYQPTGNCSKYCSKTCKDKIWSREKLSRAAYEWAVKIGRIKQPGVGSGNNQGFGSVHHSFKPNAPHRFRDYIKESCERCGSKKFLCGHHKDYDHDNNNKNNIETLCKSCHQKEHKVWQNFHKTKGAKIL